jgi:hypothetical protein
MFFLIILYSQKKKVQIALAYYTNLANSSIKENKYKDALLLLRSNQLLRQQWTNRAQTIKRII